MGNWAFNLGKLHRLVRLYPDKIDHLPEVNRETTGLMVNFRHDLILDPECFMNEA